MEKTVSFGDRAAVPAIGQGTWYMGEDRARRTQEVAALRAGVERGLTVIDTAEMYAHGGAEEVVGEAIRGLRDRVSRKGPEVRYAQRRLLGVNEEVETVTRDTLLRWLAG